MQNRFKQLAISALSGLVGLGVPSALINHMTGSVAPGVVLVGVLLASLVGYGFGTYSISKTYEDAGMLVEDPE